MKDIILKELTESQEVLNTFLSDISNIEKIEAASQLLIKSVKSDCKIISCGKGGSMADAIHFAEELTGRFRNHRKAIPAMAISDPGYISCVSNDFGYEHVFSRYIQAFGKKDDCLLAISTSGNSENVLKAVEEAQERGMKVIALTGKDGGKLGKIANVDIRVPHFGFADRIQEVHIKIVHILILLIEKGI